MAPANQGLPRRSGWMLMWKVLTLYFGIIDAALGLVLVVAGIVMLGSPASLGLTFGGLSMIASGVFVALLWLLIRRLPAPPSSAEVRQRTDAGARYMEHLAAAPERGRIRSMGIAGTATVVATRETGQRQGMNPLVQLDLDVALTGRPKYRLVWVEPIAPIVLGGLKPGRDIVIHVDPADPNKVVLDY